MRFAVRHEIEGRMRIHVMQKRMTFEQADTLLYALHIQKFVTSAKVSHKTCDAVVTYVGSRDQVITFLKKFHYESVEAPAGVLENSGRALNEEYWEKLVGKLLVRSVQKMFFPRPIQTGIVLWKSLGFLKEGIQALMRGRLEVAILDATAITAAIVTGDYDTAGSVMFLLTVGGLLEEWTHKKSVGDLARSLSLNTDKVWRRKGELEELAEASAIQVNDLVVVHMGNVIPFDGEVEEGEAMVNQASLTGESLSVRRSRGNYVYAGTVLEEGELTLRVKEVGGGSRYEKIAAMIEESEKLKSAIESKAEHLADRLVPYTLGGTALTYLLTGDITKAMAVLMVDFSCALKLAMPISVLSAIRESGMYDVTVKGGKYFEAVSEAETIVFDKTGTLTRAMPRVVQVVSFNGETENDLLRIAACLEEHFPHSMAKAVVEAAKERGLEHEEMHSKVEYIVAHGVVTGIQENRVIIGSRHFVFEDEGCVIPEGKEELFESLPQEYSHLYLAVNGSLAAVISIEDPLREEAAAVIASLKRVGIKKVVMMTGDGERTAAAIAGRVGVDEYYSEVLPADKAKYVEKERQNGRRVIMVGDGINDSPALSAADVGIAVSEGAQIAREIADITIGSDDLFHIVTLKCISDGLMKRIEKNYRFIVGFNLALIGLGLGGMIQPTTAAFLHNASTLGIGMKNMRNILT